MTENSKDHGSAPAVGAEPRGLEGVKGELKQAAEIAKNARGTFFGLLLACAYSYLTIFTTRDSHLLANSTLSKLPVIGAEVPIAWFYSIGPLLLVCAFLYFHLYLQGMWRCLARAISGAQDLSELDDHVYPWMISSSLVGYELAKRQNPRHPLTSFERFISLFFGWWFVPLTVLAFWQRFLVRHDWQVTALHVVLIGISCGAAVGFSRLATQTLGGVKQESTSWLGRWRIGAANPAIAATSLAVLAVGIISIGALFGAPADYCRNVRGGLGCGYFLSGSRILEKLGVGPYALLENVEISGKPSDWVDEGEGLKEALKNVEPASMSDRDIRFGNAAGAFLAAADLTNADMSFINLSSASLQGAQLSRAKLIGARLTGVSMQQAELEGAELTGADLYESDLSRANLDATRLEGVDLVNAKLEGAVGAGPQLNYADLRKANLSGVMLLEANFDRAQLMRAILTGSTLEDSTFTEADFRDADLRSSFLNGADMKNAVMDRADFTDAELLQTDLSQVSATEAQFSEVLASRALFRDATLDTARFNGADLRNTECQGASFVAADLSDSSLQGADFTNAVFRFAKLTNANAAGAIFKDADLSGADLSGTNLSQAVLSGAIGITSEQLGSACGDDGTKLPEGLKITSCVDALRLAMEASAR